MTLRAIADQLNTTTMTVYRKLDRAGLNIADLRDESGALTAEGVATIGALFDGSGAITGDTQTATSGVTSTEQVTQHDTEQHNMVELARLQAENDGLRALLEQVTGERDSLREQLAAAQAALAHEQADRQQERQLLTAGVSQDRRRWRWPWQRGNS